ncbi:hypothetical protein AJ79_08149 [Helicocarpus griseus UAMH5409]|uniref:Uncharacterized protein n=1 Tax=Helicocarpus griseus UAMH5409 TaxID=1447875 RepID=A0A2B7WVL6_9EURO|nr:hypothetical protein AJ79_08149 [Helicocarpus griseus UAMH5409]
MAIVFFTQTPSSLPRHKSYDSLTITLPNGTGMSRRKWDPNEHVAKSPKAGMKRISGNIDNLQKGMHNSNPAVGSQCTFRVNTGIASLQFQGLIPPPHISIKFSVTPKEHPSNEIPRPRWCLCVASPAA